MRAPPRRSQLDLDADFDRVLGRHQYDCVLVLDVLEHLKRPEEGVRKIAEILKPGGTLYASTGNIAFLVMRLSLFLGQFNYGKRGILDLTHTRLFTIYSFKKLLTNGGFVIKEVHGFGPPIRDMVGASATIRLRRLHAPRGIGQRRRAHHRRLRSRRAENVKAGGAVTNDTTLSWDMGAEADLAGYEIVIRETTVDDWESVIPVGKVARYTFKDFTIDNVFMGVRAVDKDGNRSPVRTPEERLVGGRETQRRLHRRRSALSSLLLLDGQTWPTATRRARGPY